VGPTDRALETEGVKVAQPKARAMSRSDLDDLKETVKEVFPEVLNNELVPVSWFVTLEAL